MNRYEIRDILKAHKEHFRVLPPLAQNELNGIIDAIDAEPVEAPPAPKPAAAPKPRKKKPVKSPAAEFTTGKKKTKKKGK